MRPWEVEFEEFVRARSHALLRYGLVLTGSADDAADLVQEALLKLSSSWRRVRNKDDPEGYVRTIMARQHVSWWRRRRREQLTAEVPSPVHEDEHELGEIWQRLRALPARQRAVLVLRYRPAPGVVGLRCGATWCTGTRGNDTVVQRGDGSGYEVRRGLRGYPYRDRFFVGSGEIYDARTRTTVTFEGTPLPAGGRRWSVGEGVVSWTQGGRVRVVNLAAVPQP
ncbi:SigE family RNA polymerase sigma factor [Nonomuraea wenchangensis]